MSLRVLIPVISKNVVSDKKKMGANVKGDDEITTDICTILDIKESQKFLKMCKLDC